MSYEGYVQCLCPNGHLFSVDCYNTPYTCDWCAQEAVWENHVDETNCDGYGYIDPRDMAMFQTSAEQVTCCPTCNQATSRIPATYRIPTDAERKALQQVRDTGAETFTYEPLDPVAYKALKG